LKRAVDIVSDLFSASDAPAVDPADWLPALWPAVAGEALAATTRAVGLRHGILYVEVAGAEWVAELNAFEGQLRLRLNERAGRQVLRRIVFRPGAIARKPPMRAQSAEGVDDPIRRAAYGLSKRTAR
jgi:predicted nucleic acid-binding Zn ribbon protein